MKRAKETKRRWGRVAVVLALIGGMVLVLAGPTSAADEETMATDMTMAADVVDVFMSDQGVSIDDELRDVLETEILSAFDVGAMVWTTLGELGFGWSSSPSTTDADPTAPLPGELLRERIRERIQEQLRIWDVVVPSGARCSRGCRNVYEIAVKTVTARAGRNCAFNFSTNTR